MKPLRIAAFLAFLLVLGCMSSRDAVVTGAGPGELLKLRAGPGLGYKILVGLPDGTRLTRQDCVTELGQLWCKVTLTETPGVSGYVSADYLSPV